MPKPLSDTIATVLRRVDASLEDSRGRLFDLLRIPSISAQPAHRRRLRARRRMGARAAFRPWLQRRGATDQGHPVVVAHHPGPADYKGPHVLFYGHYDVQPVDPLELWHSPPFEPQLVDGPHGKRYVARGAVDDKGQAMMFLEALRAWHRKPAAASPPASPC